MTTNPHKSAALGQIHPPVNWSFTTTTARRTPGVYVSTDLGSEAMQTDTSPPTFWKLIAISGSLPTVTPTWAPMNLAAEVTFNGLLSSLYGGTNLQVVQGNLGIVEGGTLRHTAGSGPVLTLTGTRTSPTPTSINVTTTLNGALGTWQGLLTYRDGTTQAFTSASTVALTGLATGLTLGIAAGSAVAGTDTWAATAATWTDQSGATKNYAQATAANQLIITPGLNGVCGLLSDASATFMESAALAGITTPGSTPLFASFIFRSPTWTTARALFGDHAGFSTAQLAQIGTTPNLRASNDGGGGSPVGLDSNALPVNTFGVVECYWSNTTGDFIQAGTGTAVTGASMGNTAINGRTIGNEAGVAFGNVEVLGIVYHAGLPSSGLRADARAGLKSLLGGSLAA